MGTEDADCKGHDVVDVPSPAQQRMLSNSTVFSLQLLQPDAGGQDGSKCQSRKRQPVSCAWGEIKVSKLE